MITDRRVKIILFTLFALPLLAFMGEAGSGCKTLTVEDQAGIARDGVRIDMCVAKTHACKLAAGDAAASVCWPVYDGCMVGAGMKDGGSHE